MYAATGGSRGMISVLLPVFYMLGGVVAGRFLPAIRGVLSKILTRTLIPYVIAYNLLTYQGGAALLAAFSLIFCIALFTINYAINREKLMALSFSYLNIGWLGLPIAIAILGDTASRVIIAVYVGSSVFGNVVGVAALKNDSQWKNIACKTLTAPPVIAVIIGLGFRNLPINGLDESAGLQFAYDMAKQLMSIIGMCILGIWLYNSKITIASLRASVSIAFMRLFAGAILVGFFVLACETVGINVAKTSAVALFMLPLLPPAANIVVLETAYRGTGHSVTLIASGTIVSLIFLSVYALAVVMFVGSPG